MSRYLTNPRARLAHVVPDEELVEVPIIYIYNSKNLYQRGTIDTWPLWNLNARIAQIQADSATRFPDLVNCSFGIEKPKKEGDPYRIIFTKKIGQKA